MSEELREKLSGNSVNLSTLVALAVAVITGVFGYGQLSQRVQALEDLQPVTVSTKLAVIESNQISSAREIEGIRRDLSEIRRQLQGGMRP